MVNLVTIGGRKYHVDVGFGANGPVVPMELEKSRVQPHIAPATARLRWDNIPRNTDPDQRLWIYEVRFDDKSEFQIMYCFTELEFLPSDFAMANYYMSTSPRTFFTRTVVAEKKILTEDGEVIGNLIMGNANLKWRIRGEKSKEINFEDEADRLKALEEHFGIVFGRTERESIQGLPSELNKNAR
jgi:arylamine N-acetyltransferase